MKIAAIIAVAGVASAASAANLFDADFSGTGGFTHTTASAPAPGPQSLTLNNFSIYYDSTPATDTTDNYFRLQGGVLASSDFGGEHGMTSGLLDVSTLNLVNFSLTGNTVGASVFNNAGVEFFQGWYSLDGAPATAIGFTTADGSLDFATDIDVSAASTLEVGFLANVNGAGDGFDISSVVVTPTPGTAALFAAAGIVGIRRRRA